MSSWYISKDCNWNPCSCNFGSFEKFHKKCPIESELEPKYWNCLQAVDVIMPGLIWQVMLIQPIDSLLCVQSFFSKAIINFYANGLNLARVKHCTPFWKSWFSKCQ